MKRYRSPHLKVYRKVALGLSSSVLIAIALSSCEMPLPKQSALSSFSCGDLLKRYDQSLEGLTFQQCETGPGEVVADAVYRVTGNPALIEQALIERYGMAPLAGDCCHWKPKNNGFGAIQTQALKNELGDDLALSISLEGEINPGALKAASRVLPTLENTQFNVLVSLLQLKP